MANLAKFDCLIFEIPCIYKEYEIQKRIQMNTIEIHTFPCIHPIILFKAKFSVNIL